jgi:vancomycin resistance protein YoaR
MTRVTPGGRETAGGRVVLLLLVALVLIFGGGYAAAAYAAGDQVPRGTSVAGVDIGGLSPATAEEELEEGLADRVDDPITLTVDGRTRTVSPEDAGLSVDYAASVAEAGGDRSWHPRRVWDYYTGGDDLPPVVTVDEAALAATADDIGEWAGRPARDGDVRFTADGRVRTVAPRAGQRVTAEEVQAALAAAYLRDDATAEVALTTVQPDVDGADVDRAVQEFANPAMSSPVTLVFDRARVRLLPREYAHVLGTRAEDGELVPELDEKALIALVGDQVGDNGRPVDASFRIVDGVPKVVPARPGVRYRTDDVSDTFLDLVQRPSGEREQRVKATVARADFTTREARALKIRERVSTFTTYFPYAEYRNVNISRAAELVDGTVLEPDEVVSLNRIVGERTRANGFTEGFVISDGIFKEDLGGGVSQMATTTFNAMFFAGLEDIEHKPHSFYIDRYPVGREATVAWPTVDLRFRNDTPYGVLVKARVTPSTPSRQGVVTVSMYSTKYWDITSSTSGRYNYTEEQTRVLRTPDCYPNDGYAGFDVDVTRVFRRHGQDEVDHRETFHTTYTPSDTVICRPPGD